VALSPLAVRHNTLILGKTQKGKTTVALHLAQAVMAEPGQALVVTLAPVLY
jgi:Flp pilus assembly CpaF family ATPase